MNIPRSGQSFAQNRPTDAANACFLPLQRENPEIQANAPPEPQVQDNSPPIPLYDRKIPQEKSMQPTDTTVSWKIIDTAALREEVALNKTLIAEAGLDAAAPVGVEHSQLFT